MNTTPTGPTLIVGGELITVRILVPLINPSDISLPDTTLQKHATHNIKVHESVFATSAFFTREIKNLQPVNGEHVIAPKRWANASIFLLYMNWLYTRVVYTVAGLEAKEAKESKTKRLEGTPKPDAFADGKKEVWDLLRCYALGQTIQDATFTDIIMTCIITALRAARANMGAFVEYFTHPQNVQTIYYSSPVGAPLRKLAAQSIVRFATHEDMDALTKSDSSFRQDFKNEVLNAYYEYKPPIPGTDRVLAYIGEECAWHEHTKMGKPCWK